jgi:hypothetical protein
MSTTPYWPDGRKGAREFRVLPEDKEKATELTLHLLKYDLPKAQPQFHTLP